jgi:hypothetical protein
MYSENMPQLISQGKISPMSEHQISSLGKVIISKAK